MSIYTRRPFVVDLRDWLSCLALLLASVIMLTVIVVGYRLTDALRSADTTPDVTQLVPDPGVRPSPHPGPPIQQREG